MAIKAGDETTDDIDIDIGFDLGDIMEAYDIDSLDGFTLMDEDDGLDTRYMQPRLKNPVTVNFSHAKDLANAMPLEKGANLYGFVSGNFIFGDILEALAMRGVYAVECYICTLSMSEDNVDSLKNVLLMKRCEALNVIVSHYFYAHERNRLIPYMYQELDHDDIFQLAVAGIHSKIMLIKSYTGLHLTIHGSANMRSSMNIEQLHMVEDAPLYEFNKRFMDDIIAAYKTIDKKKSKGLRGDRLWQRVQGNTRKAT